MGALDHWRAARLTALQRFITASRAEQPLNNIDLFARFDAMLANDPLVPSASSPKRRVRRPTLASQLRAIWKAARAESVTVAVTVEDGKVSATPVNDTATDSNEWDRELGTNPPSLRQ